MVGLLVGDLVRTVDAGEVVVIAGQKPHALGHEVPTSNPASSVAPVVSSIFGSPR